MAEKDIPIQPVEQPILCSPFVEPHVHWVYDSASGVPSKVSGRRDAGYWYKSERTGSRQIRLPGQAEEERDDLPLVNELRKDVKKWRESGYKNATETTKTLLYHWRRTDRERRLFFCQLEAVETILYLREILAGKKGLPDKPRLKRNEYNKLVKGQNPRPGEWVPKVAQPPTLIDRPNDPDRNPIHRYACKMATGSGKTVVMAMLIAWTFCNRAQRPSDPRFPGAVLVVCPNLTIKERLSVLRPEDPNNYFDAFGMVPSSLRPALAKGMVLVENWHRFNPESEEIRIGGVPIGQLGPETDEVFAEKRLGDLWTGEPVLVLNDEGHHAYRPAPVAEDEDKKLTAEEKADREAATVWVTGLDRINSACGISFCVDLSATPFYIHGSGYHEGSPFPWIVSDFSLVDAIESGITKIPRLPIQDNTGRPDPKYFKLWENITQNLKKGEKLSGGKPKPEVVYRKAEDAMLTLAGMWKGKFDEVQNAPPGQDRTPPVMILVCDNTSLAEHFHKMISGEQWGVADAPDEEEDEEEAPRARKKKPKPVKRYENGLRGFPDLWNERGAEVTLRIDTNLLAQAESEDPNATRKAAAEELRRIVSTVGKPGEPGESIRCVVSVNMLSEGWDASNVTHILGLRAFGSQLLCEQVVGRGLRRMDYTPDPETGLLTPEYVDIFGVPFTLIPFKGRGKGQPPPPEPSKHVVMSLEERKKDYEIKFPMVEGYVMELQAGRIHCDVASVEKIVLDPSQTPTAAFIHPQVSYKIGPPGKYGGFAAQEVSRELYYQTVHPQTIAFEIAREIVRNLSESTGSRNGNQNRAALFPQVFRIVTEYIDTRVDLNGCHPSEVGLQTYARRIIDLLTAAILPDEGGEAPLLPRLNRYQPIGSTDNVFFKTVKPIQATMYSHLNSVACDTGTWEQAAMFQIEQAVQNGVARTYARNDRLEFTIPYERYGLPHVYEPDFLVKLANGTTLVVEIKGREPEGTEAKHQAASRWVQAVNNWGELGKWDFVVCRDPQKLGVVLAEKNKMGKDRAS